jgi:hypothetical protein
MAIDRSDSCIQQPNGTSVESPTDAASQGSSACHRHTADGEGSFFATGIVDFQSIAIELHGNNRQIPVA